MRAPLSKEAFSQPKEAYDAIDLDPGVPPFYVSVNILILCSIIVSLTQEQGTMSCPFEL
jgi:hypothetical protein